MSEIRQILFLQAQTRCVYASRVNACLPIVYIALGSFLTFTSFNPYMRSESIFSCHCPSRLPSTQSILANPLKSEVIGQSTAQLKNPSVSIHPTVPVHGPWVQISKSDRDMAKAHGQWRVAKVEGVELAAQKITISKLILPPHLFFFCHRTFLSIFSHSNL